MARVDGCRFCAIANGEERAHVVFEDEVSLAFLDHRPLFGNAKFLSGAIRSAMESQGAFVALNNIVSQSVPHLHIHLVPRNRKDGLRGFFWPRSKYKDEADAEAAAAAVRRAIARTG